MGTLLQQISTKYNKLLHLGDVIIRWKFELDWCSSLGSWVVQSKYSAFEHLVGGPYDIAALLGSQVMKHEDEMFEKPRWL